MRRLLSASITVVAAAMVAALSAQTPESPAFEVASVRISGPGITGESPYGLGRWGASAIRLDTLLVRAFDVERPILGLPEWWRSEYYYIAAKAEDGVVLTPAALRPRLERLLRERFKLVTHIETREVKGYALVVAKGGPKLIATTKPLVMASLVRGMYRSPSMSMDFFAKQLGLAINQSVIDETGLTGHYDLTLTYAPEAQTDSSFPSIFTALPEQLGLRLESKRVPVKTLVIDHVEHPTDD